MYRIPRFQDLLGEDHKVRTPLNAGLRVFEVGPIMGDDTGPRQFELRVQLPPQPTHHARIFA